MIDGLGSRGQEVEGKRRETLKITLIFTLLAVAFNYPLFKKLHYLGADFTDWIYWLTWHNITRNQIINDHIFPLWQHVLAHTWDGYPHFHNPQTDVITPFVIPVLLFGETIGVKINWTLHLIIGMAGMFYVSEYFNGKGRFNLIPPVVFMLSGYFTIRFAGGHGSWYTLGLLPPAFYLFLKGGEKKIYAIHAALLLSLIFYEGGQHIFIWSFMFIGIYAIMSFMIGVLNKRLLRPDPAGTRNDKTNNNVALQPILSLVIILLLTVGLTAAKLFPMTEMFQSYFARPHRGYEIADLVFALFNRHQTIETVRPLADFSDGAAWWEFGAYVGILPVVLAIIGMAASKRNHLPLLLTGAVILWMTLRLPPPFDLWEKIHEFPVMKSQRVPTRFITLFIFVLAIMAGAGLRYLSDRVWIRRVFTVRDTFIFPLLVFIMIYIDLLVVNSPGYYYALQKKTVVASAVRPEVTLVYGGEAVIKEYLPHRITVQVNTDTDNLLVFKNMAYWANWKSTAGKVFKYNYLFQGAVISPADKIVTFYYSPESFKAGIVVSVFTFVVGVGIIMARVGGSRGKEKH